MGGNLGLLCPSGLRAFHFLQRPSPYLAPFLATLLFRSLARTALSARSCLALALMFAAARIPPADPRHFGHRRMTTSREGADIVRWALSEKFPAQQRISQERVRKILKPYFSIDYRETPYGKRISTNGGKMLVKISDKQAADLEQYSNISGVPIQQLLHEACSDYIECVVSSRTEALERKMASA